jgi:large subunit ribosomal protein L18
MSKKTLKRRRRESKTDYSKRLKLLKSGKSRLVIRKTNKYIIAQYVESLQAKDKIILGVTSKELLKFGWPENAKSSLKTLPAAYLTGFLISKKIQEKKLDIPILDSGMIRNIHKNKIYAFLKGTIDSGLQIKTSEKKDIFPVETRIKGEHLKNKNVAENFEKIKSNIK